MIEQLETIHPELKGVAKDWLGCAFNAKTKSQFMKDTVGDWTNGDTLKKREAYAEAAWLVVSGVLDSKLFKVL